MTPEDIGDIFQELEDALFAMVIRNMDAHQNWEKDEGFKWTQWQAEQIKGLREYREKVNIMTNKGFDEANEAIKEFLQEAYDGSVDDAAGLAVKAGKGDVRPAFFGVNSDKMNIILDEAVKDIDTKRYACINRMNSGYTDFLRKADIFAQSGSMTIPQALDYAMKDFLAAGLNCVEYSNGNRVNIASYAEMALRTSSSEVTRQANGDVRDALGEHLVVSNVIGMTCPYCQKWQGRVLIDDVYSDGKPDGKHQLVSDAKADGFMHPNCRHQLFMYIEGITEIAELPNDVETKEHYKAEQEQRRQEREIRKYKRLRDGAVDPADRQKYDARTKEWSAKHDQFLREHPYLKKNPKRLVPGFTGNGKPRVDADQLFVNGSFHKSIFDKDNHPLIVKTVKTSITGFKVAEGVELTDEKIKTFDRMISFVSSMFDNPDFDSPEVIIVPFSGLINQSTASYNSIENTLRIFEGFSDQELIPLLQKDGAVPDNENSTLLHEFIHWDDACKYQRTHGKITERNLLSFLSYLDDYARGILGDSFSYIDANDISYYAAVSFIKGSYNETYTEKRVLEMLGGGINA